MAVHADIIWAWCVFTFCSVFGLCSYGADSFPDDDSVKIRNACTGECALTLSRQGASVTSAAFSADGATVLAASLDDDGARIRMLVRRKEWQLAFGLFSRMA